MGETDQREFIEGQIAEKCGALRATALRLAQLNLKMEILKAQKAAEIQTFSSLQEDLQRTADMAAKMLGLGNNCFLSVETGKITPQGTPNEGQSEKAKEDSTA